MMCNGRDKGTQKFIFPQFNKINQVNLRTAVAQWLRCCATNRKVSGSLT